MQMGSISLQTIADLTALAEIVKGLGSAKTRKTLEDLKAATEGYREAKETQAEGAAYLEIEWEKIDSAQAQLELDAAKLEDDRAKANTKASRAEDKLNATRKDEREVRAKKVALQKDIEQMNATLAERIKVVEQREAVTIERFKEAEAAKLEYTQKLERFKDVAKAIG